MNARLSRKQAQALGFAVAVVLAGMAMGFLSSYLTLYSGAQAHGWHYPWRLPLAVDSGILAYVVLDHLAVSLGSRSRWLHLAAWSFAAFTVWANAALSTTGGTVWRVIDAAMPAIWVLGVEALRFTWKRVHEDPAARPDRIPLSRYLAAPLATAGMQRRMWLTAEKSYPRAVALEDARLHARDLIRAATEADPAPVIPAALRRAVRSGRLPASVVSAVDMGLAFGGASQWEPEVASWVTSRLTLSDRLAAQLEGARQSIAEEASRVALEIIPEAPAEVPPESTPAATPQRASAKAIQGPPVSAIQKVRRTGGRKATDEDVLEAIREMYSDGGAVTVYRVVKELKSPKGGIGDARAKRLFEVVRDERPSLTVAK